MSSNRTNLFIIFFLIIYFLHFTIAQSFITDLTSVYYIFLTIGLSKLLKKNTYKILLLPLVIASLLSLIFSENLLPGTFLRWLVWFILILVSAPLVINFRVIRFRNSLWWGILYLFVVITIISFFWIILELPNYGISERYIGGGKYFRNGITTHEMILAPIASIVGIFTLFNLSFKYLSRVNKLFYFLLLLIAIFTMLMASSRTSIFGFFIISSIIAFLKFKTIINFLIRKLIIVFFGSLILIIPFSYYVLNNIENLLKENTRLESKGVNNSREQLWEARFEDLKLNPITGAGFHSVSNQVIVSNSFSGVDKDTGRVEFGSLYLQALSTMGVLGFISLLYFIVKICSKGLADVGNSNESFLFILIFFFMLIHFITEAYAFSAGGILCLFFWLTSSQIYKEKFVIKSFL